MKFSADGIDTGMCFGFDRLFDGIFKRITEGINEETKKLR